MSKSKTSINVKGAAFPKFGIFVGVFWALWGPYGFWWALLYAAFWPVWFGFRLAQWLAS